ncbi:MAG: DUF4159 domain-containing protein [Planctomycetota bacterium]|nr:DUF4159 domain-containing protein [Planctomycetota bacterium]
MAHDLIQPPRGEGSGSRLVGLVFLAVLLLAFVGAAVRGGDEKNAKRPRAVRVGAMSFDKGKPAVCYADAYLADVARRTGADVDRKLTEVDLASKDVFNFPMVIMTGDDTFAWSDAQAANAKAFLDRGGFILGSAACNSPEWATSFKAAMAKAAPGEEGKGLAWKTLAIDHPIFHTLHKIEKLRTKQASVEPVIEVLERGGRIIALFSPVGLNDAGATGGRCCCCGRDEMQDADQINANILAYVLTH